MSGTLISSVAYFCLYPVIVIMPRFTIFSPIMRGVLWPVFALLILRMFLGIPKDDHGLLEEGQEVSDAQFHESNFGI